jgi:two-component system cell cycle sensor histidine kinase/response regulator CckA
MKHAAESQRRIWRDTLFLAAAVTIIFFLSHWFELFERFTAWLLIYDRWKIDDLACSLIFLAFGLGFFSWRRWSEAASEVKRREKAEDSLRLSEELYRQIVEQASDIIYQTDAFGRFTFCSHTVAEILKYSPGELRGKHYLELVTPDSRPELAQFYARQFAERVENTYREFPAVDKNGEQVLIGQRVRLLTRDNKIVGFQAVARDMTEQRRREDAVRMMTEYRNLFQLANDGICVLDLSDGTVLDVNEKACRIYGIPREEFIGRKIRDLAKDRELADQRLVQLQTGFEFEEFETEHLRADGSSLHLIVSSSRIEYQGRPAILSINRDITESKQADEERLQLEHQLRQSQKLESVGQLAGGIAHDFNNLLTAITGYSDLTLRRIDQDSPIRPGVEEIKKAGLRAASLTGQLLAFSRRQILQARLVDLNVVVADMDKMLRRLIGEDIDLVTLHKSDLWMVKADPGQIEQVIMNLVVNARDAMPSGGKVTIETGHANLDEAYANQHFSVKPGEYVNLTVTDTGCGMSAETMKQIFEPFFTTKEIGKGTGLGLSTVYGIVKQSEGNIWVYSEPGKGTTFKIYLPRVLKEAGNFVTAVQPEMPRGQETILLVEDEEMVRKLSREILEQQGYKILQAADGVEGLRVCQEFAGPIDLMITDVVMPHISGGELAKKVASIRPEMRMLFMSGYTNDAIVRHGILDEHLSFIQKPFTPEALALKAREVIDRRAI